MHKLRVEGIAKCALAPGVGPEHHVATFVPEKKGAPAVVRPWKHGDYGEGSAEKFYPVLAGQHYKYMLRQITDIRDGRRRNANPDMVKVVKNYSDEELSAVVDYMSRLTWPERQATD